MRERVEGCQRAFCLGDTWCFLLVRYVGAGCSGLFSVSATKYRGHTPCWFTMSMVEQSLVGIVDRSGKATVCGLGRSKCEPGYLPKSADCGLQAQRNVGDAACARNCLRKVIEAIA